MKKINYGIIIPIFIFFIISIISIYSTSINSSNILSRQVIYYIIGFCIIILFQKIDTKNIFKYIIFFYILGNILLLLLLFFGEEINGSKCWFVIPKVGSFQPSEFMKLILIIMNANIFEMYDRKNEKRSIKTDVKLFFTIMIITLIPSILTFLEPDTGAIIIYFLISFVMLFSFGIKNIIFIVIIAISAMLLAAFFYFYFNYQTKFIDIFGTSFFYRIDRILDWSNKSGMQLTNALASIKAAHLFGFGIGKTPIYIPERHTDFIFSIYASNTGLIGVIVLIVTIAIFDVCILIKANELYVKKYKFVIIGFFAMLLYQQIQNIGMNIGLLPITGITLPFISYGGSSLLCYMTGIGIILGLDKAKKSTKG